MSDKEVVYRKILNKIRTIKSESKKIYTNYFNSIIEDEKVILLLENNTSIIFIIKEDIIGKLFFYSSNKDDLIDLLNRCNIDCIIDYITNKDYSEIDEIIDKTEFNKYAVYKRFANPKLDYSTLDKKPDYIDLNKIDDYGRLASMEDINCIYEKMHNFFDPICDHMISIEEMSKLIESNSIIIKKENSKLVSFNINEIFGKRLHMRYSYNEGDRNNMHSIYLKMFKSVLDKGINYVYCWINENNERSIRFHKRYDMQFDGMLDIIYTNKEL